MFDILGKQDFCLNQSFRTRKFYPNTSFSMAPVHLFDRKIDGSGSGRTLYQRALKFHLWLFETCHVLILFSYPNSNSTNIKKANLKHIFIFDDALMHDKRI